MKDVDALKRRLQKRGYVLIRASKHGYLLRSPNGFIIQVPKTPGDNRSLANLERQIRRKIAGNGHIS